MMTRSLEDIYTYEQQALELIKDHPHAEELETLLVDQINDEVYDHAHTRSD